MLDPFTVSLYRMNMFQTPNSTLAPLWSLILHNRTFQSDKFSLAFVTITVASFLGLVKVCEYKLSLLFWLLPVPMFYYGRCSLYDASGIMFYRLQVEVSLGTAFIKRGKMIPPSETRACSSYLSRSFYLLETRNSLDPQQFTLRGRTLN